MPLVLALGACLGCATLPAAAQTLVTLHVATTPIDTGAQVYNAIDIGFFRAASMSRSCPNPNSMRADHGGATMRVLGAPWFVRELSRRDVANGALGKHASNRVGGDSQEIHAVRNDTDGGAHPLRRSAQSADVQPLIDTAVTYGTLKATFPAADLFAAGTRR